MKHPTHIPTPASIQDVLFSRTAQPSLPFELISIEKLYERCKRSSGGLFNPHRIHFHSLVVVTEGASIHSVDFQEHRLLPGTLIPLTKGQVHFFNKNQTIEGFVLSFEESFITQNISEKNLFHFLHLYHTPSISIGEENIELLLPFIRLLEQAQASNDFHLKSDYAQALFLAMLLQIKRLSTYHSEVYDSQHFKDFIQFKLLVTQHYHENHNAKEYAKMLAVSYNYLNDICKEICHKTAKAFIDDWLLLEIKRNIAENKYTSQEIAYKMGFKEPSNFIRFFKKFTGATPSKFAENL